LKVFDGENRGMFTTDLESNCFCLDLFKDLQFIVWLCLDLDWIKICICFFSLR